MPSRNIVKEYASDSYYHLYNRGVNKRTIFGDNQDYVVFLSYLKRYLSPKAQTDRYGRQFKNFSKKIELLSYCLLSNHFHLLVYQLEPRAISEFMISLMTAYVRYFNLKHKRVGALFQDAYKASLIDNDVYLWHISRYIHLNPLDIGQEFENYPYSSYPYYVSGQAAEWLHPEKVLAMHQDHYSNYDEFCHDYIDYKETLDEIKVELA